MTHKGNRSEPITALFRRRGTMLFLACCAAVLGLAYVASPPVNAAQWENSRGLALAIAAMLALLFAALGLSLVARGQAQRREAPPPALPMPPILTVTDDPLPPVLAAAGVWLWRFDRELRLIEVAVDGPAPLIQMARRRLSWHLDPSQVDDEIWTRHWADLTRRRPFQRLRFKVEEHGQTYHLEMRGAPIWDKNGAFDGYRGIGMDVTAEIAAEVRARHLASTDLLTGLPNRNLLLIRLGQMIEAARERRQSGAVLALEIDRLDVLDDILGHRAADRLVRAAAGRLHEMAPDASMIASLGRGRLALILPESRRADALAFCRELLMAFAQPIDLDGRRVIVTASMGVAMFPGDGDHSDLLLRRAEIARNQAKREGRSAYCQFTADMETALGTRGLLEQDLLHAMEQREFEVFYQPQLHADGTTVACLEALLRWHHPERGLLDAGAFIDVAEESGLILTLGEWVLREACRCAARWPRMRISVNLSTSQFAHPEVVDMIRDVLMDTGLSAERLEIEIKEGILLREAHSALLVLGRLRELGVSIAMDGFGAGYTRLSSHHQRLVDKVKIDRAFIAALTEREDAAAMVKAIIALGQGLDADIYAEGIETDAQKAFLLSCGCVGLQGFRVARPMAAGEIDVMLHAEPEAALMPAAART